MPTPVETTSAIQDRIFASMQVSQKALLDSVSSWSETFEALASTLPQLELPDPKAGEVLETTIDFSKKVFASQREFATKMFEAVQPVTSAPAKAASAAKPRS